MKIKIEVDENSREEEIIIRCHDLTEEVIRIQKLLMENIHTGSKFTFFKGETAYYLPLEEILFFETEQNSISAHTIDNVYQVRYKLYELEQLLPSSFMRVSKSTILNTERIYSLTRNLSASSIVAFQHTHKQAYISRHYYKVLKIKLEEKRK